jgi:hypothetical protein
MGHTMADPPEQEERRWATIREMASSKDVAGGDDEVSWLVLSRRPTLVKSMVNIGSRLDVCL